MNDLDTSPLVLSERDLERDLERPSPMSDALSADELSDARQTLQRASAEVSRAFVSGSEHVELIFIALLARGHVLLEGVPGVAKTTLARAVAEVCGCPMKRVQFTPDLMPADILGGAIYHPERARFEVHKGPIFTHVLLADELNRAPAKTQAALLEAMQEAQVSLEGEQHPLPRPFFTIATQNPKEQAGVYQLPEAQLDRFALKLEVGYPSEADELMMLGAYQHERPKLTPQLSSERLLALQELTDRVFLHPEVSAHLVRLTRATRRDPRVALGASPRATLTLARLCKARALLHGRGFVSPDDALALAPHALSHRLRLRDEYEFSGVSPREVMSELCAALPYHSAAQQGASGRGGGGRGGGGR